MRYPPCVDYPPTLEIGENVGSQGRIGKQRVDEQAQAERGWDPSSRRVRLVDEQFVVQLREHCADRRRRQFHRGPG